MSKEVECSRKKFGVLLGLRWRWLWHASRVVGASSHVDLLFEGSPENHRNVCLEASALESGLWIADISGGFETVYMMIRHV